MIHITVYTEKGRLVSTIKLTINLEEQLHRRLKSKAAMDGLTITQILTRAVETYLMEPKKGGMKESPRKKGS